jgi:uncharacterized membrane protein YeaQ/YmgE (transglycosylase-associated protein family)
VAVWGRHDTLEEPVIGFILYLIIIGAIAGFIARAVVPGKDPMSIPMTIGLGIAGSFIGGMIVYVLSGGAATGGFFVAFACTVGLVYLVRRSRGGSLMSPDGISRERRSRRGYR